MFAKICLKSAGIKGAPVAVVVSTVGMAQNKSCQLRIPVSHLKQTILHPYYSSVAKPISCDPYEYLKSKEKIDEHLWAPKRSDAFLMKYIEVVARSY